MKYQKRALPFFIAATTFGLTAPLAMAQQESFDEADLIEEIIIHGIRGSQKAAVDVKRYSTVIVDAIVAEDIGKLPDVTIADSLQRVTGVQIQRTAGEGTSLNVRGMPQVLTTLNGEQFLSPWSITDVGANFGDIPASMIAGVDVYKSQSASLSAGGISGVIDLKTRRPLALDEGWTAVGNIEGSQGSITEEDNYSSNAFVGFNNGDDFGFTFGAFKSNTNSANYEIAEEVRFGFVNDGGDPLDLNNNGNLNDRYMVPGGFGVSAFVMEREREGFAASIQYAINDALELTGDVFYTKMDQYDRGVRTQFDGGNNSQFDVLRPGTITEQVGVIPASGNAPERALNSVQYAVVQAPQFLATTESRQNHTDAINANLELAFDNGGNLTGSIRVVHAEAERTSESARFQQGTPEHFFIDNDGDGQKDPVIPFDVTVDYRSEYPVFSYSDDLSSMERLNQFQGIANGTFDEATLDAFRADANYEFDFASFTSIDFGARYGRRDVTHTSSQYMTPTGHYSNWANPDVPADKWYEPLPGDYKWQFYPDWMSFQGNAAIDVPEYTELQDMLISYNDFGPFKGWDSGVAALNPGALDNINGFMTTLYPGARKFNDPTRSYSVVEEELSAYAQLNFINDDGLFGIPYDGNLGIRVVETQREVVNPVYDLSASPTPGSYYGGGYAATLGEPEGYQVVYKALDIETTDVSFTDVLPSVNINFFPSEEVVVRFSYNQTMSRNNLTDIGEGESLWYDRYQVDGEGNTSKTVTGVGGGNQHGNAKVKPWSANNYNVSTEWYFDDASMLSFGLFLIEIENATQGVQESRQYPDSDGVMRRWSNIWTTTSVPASDLRGFELGYKQAMTFLPGFMSNTGVEANYTYSDNDSGAKDLNGDSFPLTSNSEHQANFVFWYQGDKLSTRVAYNWRSDVFQGQVGLNTSEVGVDLGNWTEAAGYLDASINYDITDNVTVYLQGTNLTETNNRNFAQFESQFRSINVQERRMALGIRARL